MTSVSGDPPTPPPPPPPPPPVYASDGPDDPGIRRWNWGAFLLTWIWALGNRVWVGLLALIPIPLLGLVMAVLLGAKGNEWAWNKQHLQKTPADFRRSQRRWAIAGLIVWGVIITIAVIALIATKPWEEAEVVGGRFTPSQDTTEVIESADGSISLTVPVAWFEDDSLNRRAELGVAHPFAEMYAVVLRERAQGSLRNIDLDRYSAITRGTILDGLGGASEERIGRLSIDGSSNALQYELRGEIDGYNIVYLHTVVETEDWFAQILAWTLEGRYEDNIDVLRAVTNSFDAEPPGSL